MSPLRYPKLQARLRDQAACRLQASEAGAIEQLYWQGPTRAVRFDETSPPPIIGGRVAGGVGITPLSGRALPTYHRLITTGLAEPPPL